MKNRLCLLFCDYFQQEVEEVMKSKTYPDVEVLFYQADCDKTRQPVEIVELIKQHGTNAEVIIFSGVCLNNTLKELAEFGFQREELEVCFELLLPKPELQQILATGAHLFTNGMLKRWPQVSQSWGFDDHARQAFFAEGTSKLVLLTSPDLPADIETMTKVASQLGLPWETLEVSLDYLAAQIHSVIQHWRDNK
jgi:hypothetical protein